MDFHLHKQTKTSETNRAEYSQNSCWEGLLTGRVREGFAEVLAAFL